MPRVDRGRMSTGDVPEPVDPVFYKWVCPVCSDARGGRAADADRAREEAVSALRVHVQMTADDDHASRLQFPVGADPDSLDEHVEVPAER